MLDDTVKKLPSINSFEKHLIQFIRPPCRTFYGISERFGIKLLTKVRVWFSDSREHANIDLIVIFNAKVLLAFVTLAMRYLLICCYARITTSTG